MNCYIETLSWMRSKGEILPYRTGTEEMACGQERVIFWGMQTNETPTKYYIWKMVQKKEMLDKIIVLVTKECLEASEALDGQSTYDYYREAIGRYIEELAEQEPFVGQYLAVHGYGSVTDYLQAVLLPVRIPERTDTREWRGIVDTILACAADNQSIDLYVDVTGGSRIASMISLLLLKVLEPLNARVQQVIYSDISNQNDRKLVDCTGLYQMIADIESIAKAENSAERIIRKLIEMGIADQSDLEGVQDIDDHVRESEQIIVSDEQTWSAKQTALEKQANDGSAVGRGIKHHALKKAKDKWEMDSFAKLKELSDEELIKTFHERIIDVLYEHGVIVLTDTSVTEDVGLKLLKEELKAKDRYYEFVNPKNTQTSTQSTDTKRGRRYEKKKHKNENGVIPFVYNLLVDLFNSKDSSNPLTFPTRIFKTTLSLDYVNGKFSYIQTIKTSRFDITTPKMTSSFQSYLDDEKITTDGLTPAELDDWKRVYYNYSFPFMCVSGRERPHLYPEVMTYYRKKIWDLMGELDKLKRNDSLNYRKTLEKYLQNPQKIAQKIPYYLSGEIWKLNSDFFASHSEEHFLKTLAEQIEQVRPYRNAFAHASDDEFAKAGKQRKMADKIRKWIDEYEAMFGKGEAT